MVEIPLPEPVLEMPGPDFPGGHPDLSLSDAAKTGPSIPNPEAPAPKAPRPKGVSEPGDPGPASEEREEDPDIDLSRWTVTIHTESSFEKVGRLYLAGTDLVIRSDLDHRGFSIALADVAHVLDGEIGPVRLIGSGSVIGSARTSSSGKAMNFSIPPFLYTTPLRSLCPVLDEQARKAPLFVGREAVEG